MTNSLSYQITNLRKQGCLNEAKELCETLLNQSSIDTYEASAVFWVYRELCKHAIENKDMNEAKRFYDICVSMRSHMNHDDQVADKCLNFLKKDLSPNSSVIATALSMARSSNTETAYDMVKDIISSGNCLPEEKNNLGWIIYYYLKANYRKLGSTESRRVLVSFMNLNLDKPSMVYSNILRPVSLMAEEFEDFRLISFIKMWGHENFSREDKLEGFYEGRTVPSLVDTLMTRCIKAGSSRDEIKEAFGCDVNMENVSRETYFRLFNLSKNSSWSEFWEEVNRYLVFKGDNAVVNEFHSKILSSIIWNIDDNNRNKILDILPKWGYQNFRPEDWKKEKKDDAVYDSLAEKAVSCYIKALKNSGTKEQALAAKPLFETFLRHYPSDETVTRELCLILKEEGNTKIAFDRLKNLVKNNPSKWYLWSEIEAYIDTDNLNLRSAVCAKAITLQRDEQFIGKVHLRLSEILIEMGMQREALCEVNKYIST